MKDAVVIKSFKNGISLLLNPEAGQEDILQELKQKFSEAKNFFGKAQMAISMEGKVLTDSEQVEIVNIIKQNSDLKIVCIVGKDEVTEQRYVKALDRVNKRLMQDDSMAQIFKSSLTDGMKLTSEQPVVILGDVDSGCIVTSTQNIYVLGALMGEANILTDEADRHFVYALEMLPEKIKIGSFKYISQKTKWGRKPKKEAKIACVKEKQVVLEPITKELLSTF